VDARKISLFGDKDLKNRTANITKTKKQKN